MEQPNVATSLLRHHGGFRPLSSLAPASSIRLRRAALPPTAAASFPILTRVKFTPRIRSSASETHPPIVEQPGGKMVVELVGAFNELSERMGSLSSTTASSRLLFKSLKLSIPLLHPLTPSPDGRSPLSRALSVACLLADLQAKRLKTIMMAAAELVALRLRDLPHSSHRRVEIDRTNPAFHLLDKNGDGRISIEELTEVMEELGAGGNDAHELMQLLDANSDGSLSSDEFNSFQRQVQFMRNLEDRDDQYRTMLEDKLHMADSLIQAYRKELVDKLAVS